MVRQGRGGERVVEVSAKNAWGKKNCLTPAFLAHTGFFFKISNYQCPLIVFKISKKKNVWEMCATQHYRHFLYDNVDNFVVHIITRKAKKRFGVFCSI